MTIEERIEALPDWVDKDLIRQGLKHFYVDDDFTDDASAYMNWIEAIVAGRSRKL